jgi:hypothetical protein
VTHGLEKGDQYVQTRFHFSVVFAQALDQPILRLRDDAYRRLQGQHDQCSQEQKNNIGHRYKVFHDYFLAVSTISPHHYACLLPFDEHT